MEENQPHYVQGKDGTIDCYIPAERMKIRELEAENNQLRTYLDERIESESRYLKALEEARVLAEKYRFDGGGLARGGLQVIYKVVDKALADPAPDEGKPSDE